MLNTDETVKINTMPTLFPVQISHSDSQPDMVAIQNSLMTYLIECVLLEQWLAQNRIEVTTTFDYLAEQGLPQAVESLSNAYQSFFAQDNPLLVLQISSDSRLLLPVESAYTAPWRLYKSCVPILYRLNHAIIDCLQPVETVETLLDILLSAMEHSALSATGITKLKESLQASLVAKSLSAHADISTKVYSQPHWYQTLIAAEQWASLMDRPFHPLAKGKLGFTAAEYQHYMAEFNQPIALVWVAVAKSHLMVSSQVTDISQQQPTVYLLDKAQQQRLKQILVDQNLMDTHVAIPVHPWQMNQVIDDNYIKNESGEIKSIDGQIDDSYTEDLVNGTVVKLPFSAPITYASASMRSMLLSADTPYSIKLPIGVYALNSKRYLPALKLINGEKNQAILMQARQIDEVLSAQLRLWDERLWWGYMSPMHLQDKSATNPYFYQEKPTHLGAMLRSLPTDLCNDQVRLLPMASLGMLVSKDGISHHIFDEIIEAKSSTTQTAHIKRAAIDCFKNLCEVFLVTMLRCLRLGLAPEMHGQNIVMVMKNHRFTSLLLRDHDSVRIYLPWLARHQIADPEYLSPPNFKNRLYRETPQALIFYLQSLGILVNIRAIIEALSVHYKINEQVLWCETRDSIDKALADIDFDADQRELIREQLLTTQYYPHKTLLLPVIERGDDPHGSMPAGESKTINPFFMAKNIDANLRMDSVLKHSEIKING